MPFLITNRFEARLRTHAAKRLLCVGSVGLALLLILSGCFGQREIKLAGKTMGTTYHITVIGGYLTAAAPLQAAIDDRLAAINASMSTYRPDSEISRFNQITTVDTPFPIGKDFQAVMHLSQKLFHITQGAWDGTLDPLIDLWGFGRTKRPEKHVPSEDAIRTRLASVGFQYIVLHPDGQLSKKLPTVSLDLASVAKGYAVDAVAALIHQKGFDNYLVEIGGEVYAAGVRIDNQPWRIGINKPEAGASADQVYHVATLQDRAFATSGDYRNFFDIDGRRYAHIIDPRTGYPVSNDVVSVSVTADTCALADGLATALMVMGAARGIDLVNQMENVECLIVTRDDGDRLIDHLSQGFRIAN
ncbi:MAG: FAD:protein FMN transferase [Deltaproteobacteria bacterium]|nr:FAD:protein FMN transferase [Deltaproteobacteria bacterium]